MRYINLIGIASLGLSAACGPAGSVSQDKSSTKQADCFNCWPDGIYNKFLVARSANNIDGGLDSLSNPYVKASRVQITESNQTKDYVIIRTYAERTAICGASSPPDGIAYLEGSVLQGEDCSSLGTKKGANWAQSGQIIVYGGYDTNTQTYPSGTFLIGGASTTTNGVTSYPLKNPDNSAICTSDGTSNGTPTNGYLVGARVAGTSGSGLDLTALNLNSTDDTSVANLAFSIVCQGDPLHQYIAKCVADGYTSGAAIGNPSSAPYDSTGERQKRDELLKACTLAELSDYYGNKTPGTVYGTPYTRAALSDGKDTTGDETSEAIWTSTGAWCVQHARYADDADWNDYFVPRYTDTRGSGSSYPYEIDSSRKGKFQGTNPDNANAATEYDCPSDWTALSDYKKYLVYFTEHLAQDGYDYVTYTALKRSFQLMDSGGATRDGHILPGSYSGSSPTFMQKKFDDLSESEFTDRLVLARFKETAAAKLSQINLKSWSGFYTSTYSEFLEYYKKQTLAANVYYILDCDNNSSGITHCAYNDSNGNNLYNISEITNTTTFDAISYDDLVVAAGKRLKRTMRQRATYYCSNPSQYGYSTLPYCAADTNSTSDDMFANWSAAKNASCSDWDSVYSNSNGHCLAMWDMESSMTYPITVWSGTGISIAGWGSVPAWNGSSSTAPDYSVQDDEAYWISQMQTFTSFLGYYSMPTLTNFTAAQNLPAAAPLHSWTLTTKSLNCRTTSNQSGC